MEPLIVLILFMSLFYLVFFTSLLDPILKRLPVIPVGKISIWNPPKRERGRRAKALLRLYFDSQTSDRDRDEEGTSDYGCDYNCGGGNDSDCGGGNDGGGDDGSCGY